MATDPRDQQLDAATAALIVTSMGEPIRASTLHTWDVRGKLQQRGTDNRGRRLYRLGDVIDLATARRRAPHDPTDLARLLDEHLDAATVALVLTTLFAQPIRASTLRVWHARGRLPASAGQDGRKRYRVADALTLARARHAQHETATERCSAL
jgi:DNA-binding transcriptional MerR regulator